MGKHLFSNKKDFLETINNLSKNTLMETLGIKYIDCGENFLVAEMPVNSKVSQPMGLLHGGATASLLESVGSVISVSHIDIETQEIRGIELSINHLRSVKKGKVIATAKIIHIGKTLHFCEVKIKDEKGRLISQGKISNIIIKKKG